MLNLKWSAVDLARGVIRLYEGETKNNEGRSLAIAGPLAEIMARRDAARLVEGKDGEPIVCDYVFHHAGRRIVDYRRAWARARVGAAHARLQENGRARSGRRRHPGARGHGEDRAQDAGHVRPLLDREHEGHRGGAPAGHAPSAGYRGASARNPVVTAQRFRDVLRSLDLLVAGARFELWKRPINFEFLLSY